MLWSIWKSLASAALGKLPLDGLLGNHLCRGLGKLHCRPTYRSALTEDGKLHPTGQATGYQKSRHSGPGKGHSVECIRVFPQLTTERAGARAADGGLGPAQRTGSWTESATCGTGGKKCRALQTPGKGPGALFS